MNLKVFTRKHVVLGLLALSAAVALPTLSPAEAAPPSYDGLWSVVIVTQQGICEPSYRAPIRIHKGHMVNAGSAQFTHHRPGRQERRGGRPGHPGSQQRDRHRSAEQHARWRLLERRSVRGHLARREARLTSNSPTVTQRQ